MKINEKKTEKTIVKALYSVCETLKYDVDGFSWLTHFVNYANFPKSLKVVVVFETNAALMAAKNTSSVDSILTLVATYLKDEGITIQNSHKAVFFDTEENGADADAVKWCRKYS